MSAAGSARHNDREGSPKRRRRRSPSPHGSFLSRYIASRKLNKVLADIQEAKRYGIELQNISLRGLYHALQDAHEKEEAHMLNHPGQPFYTTQARTANSRAMAWTSWLTECIANTK